MLNDGAIEGLKKAAIRSGAEWQLRAALALVEYIRRHPADDRIIAPRVRKWAERNGLASPPSNMAWGNVFRTAARVKLLRPVGYEQYGDDVMHTQSVRVWSASCR